MRSWLQRLVERLPQAVARLRLLLRRLCRRHLLRSPPARPRGKARGRPAGSKDKQPRVRRERSTRNLEDSDEEVPPPRATGGAYGKAHNQSRLKPMVPDNVPPPRHDQISFDDVMRDYLRQMRDRKVKKNVWTEMRERGEYYTGNRRV